MYYMYVYVKKTRIKNLQEESRYVYIIDIQLRLPPYIPVAKLSMGYA